MEENKDEKAKSDKGGSPAKASSGGESTKSPSKANGAEAAGGEQQQTPSSSSGTKATPGSTGARGWPKGKRRYPKAPGAPKQPLSGYVHFLNERRVEVMKETPDIGFVDISKKMAAEWTALPQEEKARYNERAERDKERYSREWEKYIETDEYKNYVAEADAKAEEQGDDGASSKKKSKKAEKKEKEREKEREKQQQQQQQQQQQEDPTGPCVSMGEGMREVPIFTEEFMALNKARETELKQLRKSVTEMEEQNGILAKHVDTMRTAIAKLETETAVQAENNASMQRHVDALRTSVVNALGGASLPGSEAAPTMDNVDAFMRRIQGLLARGEGNSPLVVKVREVVAKMDFTALQNQQ